MQSKQFIKKIRNPHNIHKEDLLGLNNLCHEYPYCASLHKLRLKALKQVGSEKYNNELKMTAAISGNRTLLFEYITQDSFTFHENEFIKQIITQPKEILQLGKPLKFDKSDKHSFNEWLKLTHFKPISRNDNLNKKTKLKPTQKTTKIVNFITASKNKKIPKKEFFSPTNSALESLSENNDLMTETLAKVYLEQGHYEKAITAYEILSLKYPQKSSLFANQIKAIKQLKL